MSQARLREKSGFFSYPNQGKIFFLYFFLHTKPGHAFIRRLFCLFTHIPVNALVQVNSFFLPLHTGIIDIYIPCFRSILFFFF